MPASKSHVINEAVLASLLFGQITELTQNAVICKSSELLGGACFTLCCMFSFNTVFWELRRTSALVLKAFFYHA